MKNKIKTILILLLIFSMLYAFSFYTACANEGVDIEDLLSKIDLTELEKTFNELGENEKDILGTSFRELIQNLANGNNLAIDKLFPHVITIILKAIKQIIPSFAVLLGIILLSSLLNGVKADFANKSIHSVINFASACIVGVVLCYSLTQIVLECKMFITNAFALVQAVFPVLFSILITMGAGTSAGIYQASISIFLGIISFVIFAFIIPITISSSVLSVITNVSPSLNLNKIPTFTLNFAKKTLNILFIGFSSLLAIQGLSAQAYDNVGIRIAKFSLNKYIPILGGYLSTGFDFLYAGSVILKNSIGMAFVFILVMTVLPIIIKLLCSKLLIELLSTVSSCVGNTSVTKTLNSVKECFSLALTCIVGLSLSLSIFSIITVLSFNSLS